MAAYSEEPEWKIEGSDYSAVWVGMETKKFKGKIMRASPFGQPVAGNMPSAGGKWFRDGGGEPTGPAGAACLMFNKSVDSLVPRATLV